VLASAEEGPVGVGVRNLTSSFDNTALGLKGTRPAPRNPAFAFSGVIDCLYAAWNARKNSTLVMWFMQALIKVLICRPYIRLRTLKHLTSSGWVK
jgi:hypothetical protein